jgi:hypothetical protein
MTRLSLVAVSLLILCACDQDRDLSYMRGVDLLGPISTSNGLVFAERNRESVSSFEVPSFESHTCRLPGIPTKVMRRAGAPDDVLVLTERSDSDWSAIVLVHTSATRAPAACSDTAGITLGSPTDFLDALSFSGPRAFKTNAKEACGPRSTRSEATARACAEGPLQLSSFDVEGSWDAWWPSADGRYVLLTSSEGRLSKSGAVVDVALVPLRCPGTQIDSHAILANGGGLEDVAFHESNSGEPVLALRQSAQVTILAYGQSQVTREVVITREPSATTPSEFTPTLVMFAGSWLIIGERSSSALLRWNSEGTASDEAVPSLPIQQPPVAMSVTECGGAPKVIVATAAVDGKSQIVQVDADTGELVQLQLDMVVRQLRAVPAPPHAPCKHALIASDFAEQDARLAYLELGDGFANQRLRVVELPQGLHDVTPIELPLEGTLLTYAIEGGGMLSRDGTLVRSFGRDAQLDDAVRDVRGRLWVTDPHEPRVQYVDPSGSGLPIDVPLPASPIQLLPVYSRPTFASYVVALFPSTLGSVTILPTCGKQVAPFRRGLFFASALVGENP